MGGRRRTFKLYLQPFGRYFGLKMLKMSKNGKKPDFEHLYSQIAAKRLEIELKSPTSTPHNLAIAYKMAPVKSL
jgi:hypothetical protein